MNKVEICANGQVVNQEGLAFYRLECGNASKEGFERLKNVTGVEAQMLAIICAMECLKMECDITAYTNLQFLEGSWSKIKEKGFVGQRANQTLWERLFQNKWSKQLNIIWDRAKVEYVKDKAVKTLNGFIRSER